MSKNVNGVSLKSAKTNKSDEFYTGMDVIEAEMGGYGTYFNNKVVFCNCDDPFESMFPQYFYENFEALGLKKLIAICYDPTGENSVCMQYEGGDSTVWYEHLSGDGDFRSTESIKFLEESDVVVTNPPFSLFRDFVAQIDQYGKSFILLGNQNAITYKEIFRMIYENKIWYGNSIHSNDREFRVPDDYPMTAVRCRTDNEGNKYVRVSGVRWFTNIDYSDRHIDLELSNTYSPSDYPNYDNYDAIEVGKTKTIPIDYDGVMGVPITFFDKYNPEQFAIVGLTSGRNEFDAIPTKRYVNPKQVNQDGSVVAGGAANARSMILHANPPTGCAYYTADNADGYLKANYARILIKHKRNKE